MSHQSKLINILKKLRSVVLQLGIALCFGSFASAAYYNLGAFWKNPTTAAPLGTWTATSLTTVPAVRAFHTAVWTGTKMIVWGGRIGTAVLSTGGQYDPSTDTWTATSITSVPAARYQHSSIWSGTKMIVWGGYS